MADEQAPAVYGPPVDQSVAAGGEGEGFRLSDPSTYVSPVAQGYNEPKQGLGTAARVVGGGLQTAGNALSEVGTDSPANAQPAMPQAHGTAEQGMPGHPMAVQSPTASKPPLQMPPLNVLTPVQHQQLQALGAKAGQTPLTPDGLINTEVVKNDLNQLQLDDQAKVRALAAVKAANNHIQTMQAIGQKMADDASGSGTWAGKDATTGEKVGRVLLGILTLGGSESYIGAQIRKKVAQDQQGLTNEDNTYKAMIEAGKTAEQAASIDYAKQAHTYKLGLDRIVAANPSPVIQQKVAALQAGMQKDTSTALLGYYDTQQKNRIAQEGQNTSAYNAQTERMKANAEINKMQKPDLTRLVRDEKGNPVGYADTADQAKQVQSQQLAVNALGAMSKKVKEYGWGDKFTPTARADAGAIYSQTMQLINLYRAAHPNEESSRQMEVLKTAIPDPNDWNTTPAAYKEAFNQQIGLMRMALVKAKKQSGL